MTQRKRIVAGNWKMNGSLELINQFAETIKTDLYPNVEVIFFPPSPLLSAMAGKGFNTGAQTVSEHDAGAFTGEVEAKLVRELGCKYTLIGHSERRTLFAESDAVLVKKFAKAQQVGLTPILCVGETESQRDADATEQTIATQLNAIIDKLGVACLQNSVIAYEPVWAIGTGKTATPEQAQSVHKFIRDLIASKDAQIAATLPILYGGSVNDSNSELLFAQPDIDGGLIGGASLKPDAFSTICASAVGNV
ncbi:triose-phosphate isomerase [Pseudoalteromonas fenneropenaei]|uniref:Triosephosphate isomerase n=1 Tax=Pseudoalteromonas fenneropenaei TaxID=1737459 RepID=A0ABV7CHS5_9GAMM